MKIFSASRLLTRSEAWSYAFINQLATPGLGTLLARRFITGSLQLLLSLGGFICLMIWFMQKMRAYYGQMFRTTLPADIGNNFGWAGLLLFAAAWIWSLISSIQMVRSVPKNSGLIPPKIV